MKTMNGSEFKLMLESGCNNLYNHFKEIDALNVFPVPDGDTGTNMNLTFTSGVGEALQAKVDAVGDIAKVLSKGLLMGARGNSGVILSQIFRGFYQSMKEKNTLTALDLAVAFVRGSEVAYKAVMRPVEGTILTVIREAAYYANEYILKNEDASINDYMGVLVKEAYDSLQTTPDLLPVLKEVGVVDSGGAGLLTIFQGFQAAVEGHPIAKLDGEQAALEEAEEIGYCVEFAMNISKYHSPDLVEEKLIRKLSKVGEEIQVVRQDEVVKAHVHTLTPGEVLNLGQRYGDFTDVKVENLAISHETKICVEQKAPHSKYAIITVATGDGLTNMFKELRADIVISGGQTMNPSTEDFLGAIKRLNAEHIIILPNNSNIVMAAQQAATIMQEYDVRVIPTKSIPQGLSACIMFNPDAEMDENMESMKDAAQNVCTGQVTYAIKDTTFDGLEIHAQDYMGIKEKNIVISTPNKMDCTKQLVDAMLSDSEYEILTILAGEDASDEEMNLIAAYAEETYEVEVEAQRGNQAVYAFIMGAE